LLYMREGFWWCFSAVCKKKNFIFKEVKIKHYKRKSGEAGYKFKDLIGIISRNTLGLFKIKFSKFND